MESLWSDLENKRSCSWNSDSMPEILEECLTNENPTIVDSLPLHLLSSSRKPRAVCENNYFLMAAIICA